MAFEVIVYYTPRASSAIVGTMFHRAADESLIILDSDPVGGVPGQRFRAPRTPRAAILATTSGIPQDASVAPTTTDRITWQPSLPFRPWVVVVSFGSSPDGSTAVVAEPPETPPSWRSGRFPRAWSPQQSWTPPPGDETFVVPPDTSRPQIPSRLFRDPYRPWPALRFLLGSPTLDESVTPPPDDMPVGSIPQNLHRKTYAPSFPIGYGAHDLSLELDVNLQAVTAVTRPPYRVAYNARPALAMLFGGLVTGDETVPEPPPPDAPASIVQNLDRTRYDSRRAAIAFCGISPQDLTNAPQPLTGGVYVPTYRRRRR
jgi:hypothetical protein